MTAVKLPHVPAGTLVTAKPGEWHPRIGVEAHHTLNVVIVAISGLNADLAWVRGHAIGCDWASSDCTAPWCSEVLVSVEVLRRYAR